MTQQLQIIVKLEPGEFKPFLLSFIYFFSLLCSYYILRPIRDEMGIQGGVHNLQWMFTATFIAMLLTVPLFGWASKRFSRTKLVPFVYFFLILNLLLFYGLFYYQVSPLWLSRIFFIWVSLFNLFAISVFWSFMADIFNNQQARRFFAVIGAGGSAGAICGPLLTAVLSNWFKPIDLLPLSIAFLTLATFCARTLSRARKQSGAAVQSSGIDEPISGGILSGAIRTFRSPYLLGISAFIFLYTTISTFLYFEQAFIVKAAFNNSAERTAVFATIDLVVNILTVITQLFATSRLMQRFGVSSALALVPVFLTLGLMILGFMPSLGLLLSIQIIRRAGNYAVTRPGREMLYTVMSPEDKYRSKNFIDTVIYRGGDALSGWAFAGLAALGLGSGTIMFVAVPIAAIWACLGWLLGKKQDTAFQKSQLKY